MDDLISREAAIDALILLQDHSDMPEDWHKGVSASLSCLFRVPFVERKKGKWEWNINDGFYYCSECEAISPREDQNGEYCDCPNFCPHCGADMRGEA